MIRRPEYLESHFSLLSLFPSQIFFFFFPCCLYHPLQQRDLEPLLGAVEGPSPGEKKNPRNPKPRFTSRPFQETGFQIPLNTGIAEHTNPLMSRNKCTNQDLGPKLRDPYLRKSVKNQNKRKQTKGIQKGPHYGTWVEHRMPILLSKKNMILETNKENTKY